MSVKKALTLGLLIPVGFALTLPALAMGPGGNGPGNGPGERPGFEELDANGDGQLTLDEVQNHAALRFQSSDTDGDGLLSRDELVAAAQERVARGVDRMLENRDADGDGMLSAEEMTPNRRGPGPEQMFERFDANEDGVVTRDEFDEAVTRMVGRRGDHRDGEGYGHGHGQHGHGTGFGYGQSGN